MNVFSSAGYTSGWKRMLNDSIEYGINETPSDKEPRVSQTKPVNNARNSELCIKCLETQVDILNRLNQLHTEFLAVKQTLTEVQAELLEEKQNKFRKQGAQKPRRPIK